MQSLYVCVCVCVRDLSLAPPAGQSQDLKADARLDSGVCDSGVELSTA